MTLTVLIVEDEPRLASLLADYCRHEGHTPLVAGSLAEARPHLGEADVLLLDLMLPDGNGLELCREVRASSQLPILILSARVDELDRLLGLELGADDYICKPFSPREVMARIRAVIRRSQPAPAGEHSQPVLDQARLSVRLGAQEVQLSQVEFSLLAYLAAHPGHIRSRNQIMDQIYADHRVVSDRTIDSHVKKLRQKLAQGLPDWQFVDSVYGAGYRYDPRPAAAS